MKILELYRDYSIPFATDGNKHCRPGWVQIHCPFCKGTNDFHMGYNMDSNYYYCWKHGWSSIPSTISKVLAVSEDQAKDIILNYGGSIRHTRKKETDPEASKKEFKFPSGIINLTERHNKYLRERNYDPEKLTKLWGLKATDVISLLDGTDYKHRILAPVHWNGKIVTFQARDITKKHKLKYLACPKIREIIHHKHILYANQELWHSTGIIVEGITDVWRFGPASSATFGIEYKYEQVRVIAKAFKRVAVVFDGGEVQARKKADELVGELVNRNVDAFRINIEGDPGSMSQAEADYLVKQILDSNFGIIKK